MSWVLAIGLALAAFGLAVFAFGVGRQGWTTIAAALAFGLAGYALQASPGMPGVPALGTGQQDEADWAFIEARREMVAEGKRSRSDRLIIADAFARQQQYADATVVLRQALRENPRDGEAWLALGNALVEHAGGALTQPALLAYRRAEEMAPGAAGPGYFLGLALIRQGRLSEAKGVWQSTLETAAADAAGREALKERLARLDELIADPGIVPPQDGR